uniref:Kinesin light chain n=1 Tax=Kalanchoe fedtschenkoi TaxID=63787 RepID=A0A7N0UXA2_KALFE
MRRASLVLLSRLNRCKTPTPLLPRAPTSPIYSAPSSSPPTSAPYSAAAINILAATSKEPSSSQRKLKERPELAEAFESARTAEDKLHVFKDMEAVYSERELGLASLKLALKLDEEGEDPEMVLTYATRALNIFDAEDEMPGLPVAMALQLLGSVSLSLNKFSESLGYLNRARRVLRKLEEEEGVSEGDVKSVLHSVHLLLANVKNATGRREEALENLEKCLEIVEATAEEGSEEVATANRDLAEANASLLNFKVALPYGLKALEIHRDRLGNNSVEVAHDRRLLGVIYTGLEMHQKALEQNQLAQKVLKHWGMSSDVLRAEIDAANIQIALGKYDEAINTLKAVVQRTGKDSETRALVFVSMGKALCSQEKLPDARRCLEMACGILDKKEKEKPIDVAEAYMEISMLYESMNQFETAITLLKRTLNMLEKVPEEQASEGSVSARIGWLLLLTGKAQQAIPYLESAAEVMKECFGSKHFGVAYIYNNLGAAYLELGRSQSAAQMFAVAKEIMDVDLGPHHPDSIEACQNLSKAYTAIGSYALASEFQQQAVSALESHGPSVEDELREAKRLLADIQKKARGGGGSSNEPSTKALPLPTGRRQAPGNPATEKHS